MNCKQGDLAYIVRSIRSPEAIGIPVVCLKLLPAGSDGWELYRGSIWEINKSIPVIMTYGTHSVTNTWPDADMRPIAGPSIGQVDKTPEKLEA